jgi:hypothetical protein
MLTAWKQTEEFAFLREVAAIPLQQSPRHLQGAFVAFWDGATTRICGSTLHENAANLPAVI